MNPTDLPATLRPFAAIIEEVSDERSEGDGVWVYLAPGYWNPLTETHCVHESTLKACAEALRECERKEAEPAQTAPPLPLFAGLKTKADPVAFFHEWAGSSHDPKTETPEQGRQRGAEKLARAEAWARSNGYRFQWEHDGDADRSGIKHKGPLWSCFMRNANGECVASLHSIDLGATGLPSTDPYGRVVEAELADETMPEGA